MTQQPQLVWLQINNLKKTKIPKLNIARGYTCERPNMLEGEALEKIEAFRYLGTVDTQGGTISRLT